MTKDKVKDLANQRTSGESEGQARSYGYVIVAAGFAVWFINGIFNAAFSVFLKPMQDEFGWTRGEAALAYALATIVAGISSIFMGRLTDKLGPRLVVTYV